MSETDSAVQDVNNRLAQYLNGEESKSVLTPGDVVEWPLDLKSGQVVIGEARSDAFDPAIEIVEKDKVLASNDDRYPGDQRPLLLWRCERDGKYLFRIRCFHDRSGGQVFVRFKTYNTVDLTSDQMVEKEIESRTPFLLRVPMRAGQVKDIVADFGGPRNFLSFRFNQVIFPNGLPERMHSLSEPLSPAISALVAPVAGDYYLLESPYGNGARTGVVRVGARSIDPGTLALQNLSASSSAKTDVPALWEVDVKKGDLIEASTPELHPDCQFTVLEKPDFAKFDVTKPETNPLFPTYRPTTENGPALDELPGRARDGRVIVFQARRDAKIWLATNGNGPDGKQYSIRLRPAAAHYSDTKKEVGMLRIANTDYWAFDAKAGDVMALRSSTPAFTGAVIVRDPALREIRNYVAGVDQTSDEWQLVAQQPGRYLVAVSCLGDGGAGEYSLSRTVYSSQEFGIGKPASGELAPGQVQVWKFRANPNEPLLIKWKSSNWGYGVQIYNERGEPESFQNDEMDAHNRFGLLKVREAKTYVMVFTGGKEKSSYSVELNRVPGLGK